MSLPDHREVSVVSIQCYSLCFRLGTCRAKSKLEKFPGHRARFTEILGNMRTWFLLGVGKPPLLAVIPALRDMLIVT